jgi:hypothetical protein
MATAPQFDLKGHLLSLYGLSRESTMMARFFDTNGEVIADRGVTADECWSASGACWSNFMLADGKSALALGAASVCFILDAKETNFGPTSTTSDPKPIQEMKWHNLTQISRSALKAKRAPGAEAADGTASTR